LSEPISTAPARSKKDENQALGRSRGGLSTKIHALVDALGKPLALLLTPGQAHDLVAADAFLPQMAADLLIADRAFDADRRVLQPLAAVGKSAVIPPRPNRVTPREFDRDLYKERHLIENFFCKLKQFRAIATRYDKTATSDTPYTTADHASTISSTAPSTLKHAATKGPTGPPPNDTAKLRSTTPGLPGCLPLTTRLNPSNGAASSRTSSRPHQKVSPCAASGRNGSIEAWTNSRPPSSVKAACRRAEKSAV
jgi:transposase